MTVTLILCMNHWICHLFLMFLRFKHKCPKNAEYSSELLHLLLPWKGSSKPFFTQLYSIPKVGLCVKGVVISLAPLFGPGNQAITGLMIQRSNKMATNKWLHGNIYLLCICNLASVTVTTTWYITLQMQIIYICLLFNAIVYVFIIEGDGKTPTHPSS